MESAKGTILDLTRPGSPHEYQWTVPIANLLNGTVEKISSPTVNLWNVIVNFSLISIIAPQNSEKSTKVGTNSEKSLQFKINYENKLQKLYNVGLILTSVIKIEKNGVLYEPGEFTKFSNFNLPHKQNDDQLKTATLLKSSSTSGEGSSEKVDVIPSVIDEIEDGEIPDDIIRILIKTFFCENNTSKSATQGLISRNIIKRRRRKIEDNYLGYMIKRSKIYDCKIICSNDGVEIEANKLTLSVMSPVFKKMLDSKTNMIESIKSEVKLEFPSPIVKAFMSFVYCGKISLSDQKFSKELYKLSHMYEILSLKYDAEELIISQLSIKNAIQTLEFAHIYDSEYMKKNSIKFINDETNKEILNTESFKNISRKFLMDIYMAKRT